jgi:hypothetical protein
LRKLPFCSAGPKEVVVQATGASLPRSAKVSAASAAKSGGALSGDTPLHPARCLAVCLANGYKHDKDIMMELMQEDEAEAAAHQQR